MLESINMYIINVFLFYFLMPTISSVLIKRLLNRPGFNSAVKMTEDRELLAKFRAAQQGDYGQAQLRAILPKTLSDYSFVSTLVDALQAEHPAFVDEQRPLYAYLQQRYPMFSRLYLAWASLEASQDDDGRGDQRAKDILMKGTSFDYSNRISFNISFN